MRWLGIRKLLRDYGGLRGLADIIIIRREINGRGQDPKSERLDAGLAKGRVKFLIAFSADRGNNVLD